MQEYLLFLDESKPNPSFKNFTLSGIIISKNDYDTWLVSDVEKMKLMHFSDKTLVLHEYELRKKQNGFSALTNNDVKNVFLDLGKIVDDTRITTIGASIDISRLDCKFEECNRNSLYHIALQIILENYIHFLINHNGKGSVYLESTDGVSDTKLQHLYYSLIANGTLFYTKDAMQSRLLTINFNIKSSNNIGLQIADFTANPIARKCLAKVQKNWSLLLNIENSLYDGKIGRPDRFGLKLIP